MMRALLQMTRIVSDVIYKTARRAEREIGGDSTEWRALKGPVFIPPWASTTSGISRHVIADFIHHTRDDF
jgi:hypothetical protein